MNIRFPSVLPIIKNHLERVIKIKWDKILKNPAKKEKSCTWNFGYVMQMLFYGLLTGCRNLRELETFTESYGERIPDTTLHDIIIKVDPENLLDFIARDVKDAKHNHELDKKEFPMNVAAIDGKKLSDSKSNVGDFSQKIEQNGKIYYNNRVLRALHVSNSTKLFLGQREILGKSSETSEFIPFLKSLNEQYKNTNLIEVISVDAGMTSQENANFVHSLGLHYVMALKGPQQTLLSNAEYLFKVIPEPIRTEEETQNGKKTMRKLSRSVVLTQYKHGWDHLQEFWKIEQITIELKSGKEEHETRYFLSSIPYSKLNDKQVMQLIRMHWGIENNGNWITDVCWDEDEAPFANKALRLISLMRLIAYNFISRLLNRRLRSEKTRQLSWNSIMDLIAEALKRIKNYETLKEYMYPPLIR